jgi:uncharacterized protein involved in exopolysaccharide biosynthesis
MRRTVVRGLAPWLALVTLTAAGAAAAAGYGLTAPKRYRATAQLLVAPVTPSDPIFVGIDVLRDTGGKRTAAASVAALLRAPQIVDAARAQLALRRSRQSLLDAVDSHVVDDSDVVAITAEDTSPNGAAQLANTFAHALVNQRDATFQSQLANAIRRDEGLVAGGGGNRVKARLATLQALQAQPDPTVKVASEAAVPTASSWPDLPRLVGIGAGLGAAAGVVVALVLFLLRRQGAGAAGQYDREVSDEAIEKLVDRLESRLAAREAALAARERDLRATLDELRAAQAAGPDVADLMRRERELERQLAAATEREARLEQRVQALTKREVELARRAAQVAAAERELAERPEPEPEPEPEPAAAPPPAAALAGDGHYNLLALERLVDEHGAEYPEKAEEWSSYLFFLREHAASDGRVPASFDALIQDTFEELVG